MREKMEFRDLKKQYEHLQNEIDSEIKEVIENCEFISGSKVEELEVMLADYVGSKYCISCANGTDALTLALMAWGIGKGDAVFVPDFTFFSTGESVSFLGATPVFVDVYKDTFNISIECLEEAIKKVIKERTLNPRVIVPVDLFGLPADYLQLKKIADKYNLLILEDGAQGFGGKICDKRACSFGDISTTSFFPAKPLGCYGDGGAIFTDNKEYADLLHALRIHGKGTNKYDNVLIGMNSRLDTLQAGILIPKLQAFKEYELEAVNNVAAKYTELLREHVNIPQIPKDYYSSWAQYTIQLPNKTIRDSLQEHLKSFGVPSMIYYQKPMHSQKAFLHCSYIVECNNSIQLSDTVLSLPIHPYMDMKDIALIVDIIKGFIVK